MKKKFYHYLVTGSNDLGVKMEDKTYENREHLFEHTARLLNLYLERFAQNKEDLARDKGAIGVIVQRDWYGLKRDSRPVADFDNLGIELKVTPYIKKKNNQYQAKERLRCSEINYNKEVLINSFEESHFFQKMKESLILFYEYRKDIPKTQWCISEAALLSFIQQDNRTKKLINTIEIPDKDKAVIKHDWEKIREKILNGRAHELSEGDTYYLGAATHGQTSADRTTQPYSTELAKRRAFVLKQSYMTVLLQQYVLGHSVKHESILTNSNGLIDDTISQRIEPYLGMSETVIQSQLSKTSEINALKIKKMDSKAKNKFAMYTSMILGLKNDLADTEEFLKANILVKTIRVSKTNTVVENLPIVGIRFDEILQEETWEESKFYSELMRKYFFIVYKEYPDGYHLERTVMWNMPHSDLEKAGEVWAIMKNLISNPSLIKLEETKKGVSNNFPKSSQSEVAHVRSKARDGKDRAQLNDGRWVTKQAFWLNNHYIQNIVCGVQSGD